ncbi:MAG: metallophosphoesterase [Clostridia bacterium]|nr:metallophosphoesterase [Clostridia bacterium]
MAKGKRKNKKKILICVISVVIVLGLVITGLNALAVKNLLKKGNAYDAVETENKLVPQKDENGYWYFTTDEDFKVMQITDIHIGGGFLSKTVDEKALNAIAAMVTKEKPDLVIATGDIAFPVPYMAGTFNNYSGAKAFGNLMESLGVYWTVVFGNHDAECYSYFDRESVAEIYSDEEFEHCLFQAGPENVDGYGNHVIEVKNSKGIITQAMVMIDSQAYVNDSLINSIKGTYDNIHPNQVEWYEAEIKRMNAENSKAIKSIQGDVNGGLFKQYGTVKTLAFFHIPLVEMADAWAEFVENGFKDTKDFKYIEGIIGEGGRRVYCGFGEDDLFEKMLELGSTKAMFNGHDHINNTTFEYKGIVFSYGYSIDYFAYSGIDKVGSQRGCTMITCKSDGTFNIDKYNYYSDRYELPGFTREEVTMQFEDVTYQTPEE